MNTNQEVQFFPFHAINEFMTDAYREEVVRRVLHATMELPEAHRLSLERLTQKTVRVPGFRNSSKAPAALRLKPTVEAFKKQPAMVAAILSAWAALHDELRSQVYDLLHKRGWELLPVDTDRTRLPGFLTKWPKGEDFETLYQAYQQTTQSSDVEQNDVSLMIVWLSGRLPYEFYDIADSQPGQEEKQP